MTLPLVFSIGFGLYLLFNTLFFGLSYVILGFYLIFGALTFAVFWYDKRCAIQNKNRISEKTLHLLSFVGGWIGAFLAQHYLRHKSKKLPFRVTLWVVTCSHILLAKMLLWPIFYR